MNNDHININNTLYDKINDNINSKVDENCYYVERLVNAHKVTLQPMVYNNKHVYEPIFVSFLLSKPIMLLNRFLKIYTLTICNDCENHKKFYININLCINKLNFNIIYKKFKSDLKDLKQNGIRFNELVDNTLNYINLQYSEMEDI